MCPSWGREIGACGARPAPQAENFGISSGRYDLQLDSTYARAAVISGCRRPRWRRALLDAVLLPRALLRFALSLCADLRESLSTRERQSKSVALRLARGTHESAMLRLVFAERPFFWFSPGRRRRLKKNTAPLARAEVLRVLDCSACLRRLPVGSRRPAGAVPQAPSARRRRKIFRGGAGVGRFGGQRGGQGQNITFL